MNWSNPTYLNLLWIWIVLPVVFYLAFRRWREKLNRAIYPPVQNVMLPGYRPSRVYFAHFLQWMALFFLVLALARPQWGERIEEIQNAGADVMIALDVSKSMWAEDVSPNRLRQAKNFLTSLIEKTAGHRFGLILFGGSSHLVVPLTQDAPYVLEQLSEASPNSIAIQGTSLGAAFRTAAQALDRGGEAIPEQRFLLLVTDAEDHEALDFSISELKKSNVQLLLVGVGTEQGGTIPIRDEEGMNRGTKRTKSGDLVITRLGKSTLEKISKDAGASFWVLSNRGAEVAAIAKVLDGSSVGVGETQKRVIRQERFQWPLFISVLLFLFSYLFRGIKPKKSAALVHLMFLFSGSSAFADLHKGAAELNRGNIKEAQREFSQSQAENPNGDLEAYHLGLSLSDLQTKDPKENEQALKEFARAAEIGKTPGVQERSFYNQGVLQQSGSKIDLSRSMYLDALKALSKKKEKTSEDLEFEKRVRHNLDVLNKQEQNSQKSDSKDQKDSKSESSDSDDSKSKDESDSKNDSEQKSNNQSKSNKAGSEKSSGRAFKSEKLNAEDAERVLEQLSEKDKDVLRKLRNQKLKPQTREKDW